MTDTSLAHDLVTDEAPSPTRVAWRGLPWRGVLGVVVALLVWELLYATHAVSGQYLPSVQTTLSALGNNADSITSAAGTTLKAAVIGTIIGGLVGAVVGMLSGYYRVLGDLTEWIVRSFRSIPSLAFIPVGILFFGLSATMVTWLVALACVWPVLVNTRYAARSLPREYRESSVVLHLSKLQFLTRVVLPACTPSLVSGLKTSIAIGLVATISAELIVGTGGLGGLATTAQQTPDIGLVYAVIVVGGWLGWLITWLIGLGETRLLAWNYRRGGR